jgi:hypothetical protein
MFALVRGDMLRRLDNFGLLDSHGTAGRVFVFGLCNYRAARFLTVSGGH